MGEVLYSDSPPKFEVNEKAIDQLVDALIEEAEIQLVLVPDILEAEVYRYVLHKMMCISEFVLSELRVRLFGVEVRLNLIAEEEAGEDQEKEASGASLNVPDEVLQRLVDQIETQRQSLERELKARRGESDVAPAPRRSSLDAPLLQDEEQEDGHVFERMAAQDRLARCLAIQRTVPVDIDIAFGMVSGINEYNKWMPFCTDARIVHQDGSGSVHCEVGFGLETGTALGTVGDTIRYRVALKPPEVEKTGADAGFKSARVVADATEGFTYGKRLVYDWRFVEVAPGETDVKLNMFFQARSFLFLPLWDSMQATITSVMMKKFNERATALSGGPSSAP